VAEAARVDESKRRFLFRIFRFLSKEWPILSVVGGVVKENLAFYVTWSRMRIREWK